MRLTAAILPCLLLPAAALPAPRESVVTFLSQGQEVVGTLALPEGEAAPVVLMLHGFTGNRDEATIPATGEGVFARTAALLAASGYASLRIDFRGSGDSTADLAFADTTFEGQVADALAATAHLSGRDDVDGEAIYLLGWSQGGLVATAAAGRDGGYRAVALWAAVAEPVPTFTGILGPAMMAAGARAAPDEIVTAPGASAGGLALKGAFFHGLATFDPVSEIAAWPGPLFVARGSRDTVVAPAGAERLIAAHDGPETLWSAEMDHAFDISAGPETLDALIAATRAFFDDARH